MAAPNQAVIPLSVEQALKDTFQVQLSLPLKVTVSTSSASETLKSASSLDIVSVMGIKSTPFTGYLALGFTRDTFLKMVEQMLGESYKEISPENADACSELLNIVYASARVKINDAGFDFEPAIPSTVYGKEIVLPIGQNTTFMKFLCESAKGSFFLAFSLKRN